MSDRGLAGTAIAVIGAGAVGCALAYRLSQAGARVTVIETAYPGAGTSGNSFAWLNAFGKEPRDYWRLNLRSIREHQDLQDELNGSWLVRSGAWHWADADGANYTPNLPATVRQLLAWGSRIDAYSPAEVKAIEPALAFGPDVSEVFLVHNEGWLQAALMIQALLTRAKEQYGAEVLRDEVIGLDGPNGVVDTVHLASGARLGVDMVVVAAGPRTADIATLVGSHIPLELSYGFFAVTAPAPTPLRRVAVGPRLIARPDGGGRVLLGSEEVLSLGRGASVTADSPEIVRLAAQAQNMMPDLAGVPVEAMRKGERVVPADGYPIVGWDTRLDGVYYAVTHSGITLSAALGNLVVEDLLSGGSDVLAQYRPSRFN
ncbi:NAD(P)/FAD-dependent oxidoreductase [Ornithinimicrobium cerasi]|uniref:NAD(P)/FAD-dependent oxidoreductase n=1 Tax=Ornithinimicrobium cerasi TaxID=2248773 RepID=UPI001F2D5F7C|nr:FAD-binding oxidoreductase [Ornithinimicrobium cerasi]